MLHLKLASATLRDAWGRLQSVARDKRLRRRTSNERDRQLQAYAVFLTKRLRRVQLFRHELDYFLRGVNVFQQQVYS